mgnify:CR=1 FL=1
MFLGGKIMEKEYGVVRSDENLTEDAAKMYLHEAKALFQRSSPGYRLVRLGNYPAYQDKGRYMFPVVEILGVK